MTALLKLIPHGASALLVAGILLIAPFPARADDEAPATPRSGPGEEKKERPEWRKDGEARRPGGESPSDTLSEAEKAELRSAMDAVWHDPAVLAARESMQKAGDEYREALRKSMENTNPKIREILTKMMEGHSSRGGWGRRPGPPSEEEVGDATSNEDKEPPFFKALTEEDRQILRDAKAKADEDETVKAVLARKDAAQTTDEKIAALRDLREALHKAMLAADPRVGEVLSKLPVPGRDRGEGRKGDGRGPDGKGERREDGERPPKDAKDA